MVRIAAVALAFAATAFTAVIHTHGASVDAYAARRSVDQPLAFKRESLDDIKKQAMEKVNYLKSSYTKEQNGTLDEIQSKLTELGKALEVDGPQGSVNGTGSSQFNKIKDEVNGLFDKVEKSYTNEQRKTQEEIKALSDKLKASEPGANSEN
ncbi:hypothetical protein HIM_12005 [Hirsutella minnesotensis 3608]|uniref:Uncharacterized protein n=1 Tax=Hirsutella minnesotensis 3608 TaxID=1043627 RepID=A0A0F7ZWA0_9HYPO|nr:hypothetical protein HIM_12005 [Hirsutella minnesotensis 3608]